MILSLKLFKRLAMIQVNLVVQKGCIGYIIDMFFVCSQKGAAVVIEELDEDDEEDIDFDDDEDFEGFLCSLSPIVCYFV